MAKASFRRKNIVLSVTKDPSTLQHITYITQKNPLKPIKLLIDVGGLSSWVDCQNVYSSSTYKLVQCGTTECNLAKPIICDDGCTYPGLPKCTQNQCFRDLYNPPNDTYVTFGKVAKDVVLIGRVSDGHRLGQVATIKNFIFTCVPNEDARGLTSGAKGFIGLGMSDIALQTQLSKALGFPQKFGICLSSSSKSKGVIIFGDGPYYNIDISKDLVYTPIVTNPHGIGSIKNVSHSSEYYIGVKSIKINGKALKINQDLLPIDNVGNGGTKITTSKPYTILESSIYRALSVEFLKQLHNVKNAAPVKPFSHCFDAKSIGRTRVGPEVPTIDLVLQDEAIYWRILGANSMVQINEEVTCLGFVDGGRPYNAIEIGTHQIENNLVQFDLVKRIIGFSSSLLLRQTTCGNFNFTSHA
ncbi:hypothetical protein Leryth_025461 [Lithospermum erythrorhizon]|nr:hypothetical protein Leryth_025461 [Lithospermum erythrorhizon]